MSTIWTYHGTVTSIRQDSEIELKSFIFENLMKNYYISDDNCKLLTELVFQDISEEILNNYLPHISESNSEDDFIHRFIDYTLNKYPQIKNILDIRFFI
jgi:hypothetical protein